MGSITTDIEGLSALAANCHHHAGVIAAANPAPQVGESFQATSAAVAAAHTDADFSDARFTARLLSTGITVHVAAQQYAATEAANTAAVTSVGQAV